METQKAEEMQGTSEAPTVGPASEQLGAPPLPRQEFDLPEEHRPAVEALALAENEWEIRLQCANTRRRRAMGEGDAEAAIVELRNTISCGRAHDAAKAAVEAEVRLVIPEFPDGGRIELFIPEFKVRWINTD